MDAARSLAAPPDVIEELDALQAQMAAENKSLFDYYRAVAQYVAERASGSVLMTVGQAENFRHGLNLYWTKKKAQQRDALRDALGLASSSDLMLAN